MSTTHLIHGFNVTDGGRGTIANLKPYFDNPHVHSLGLVGLIDLRCKNKEIVESLAPMIGPDDIIIAHSNGALITWRLLQKGVRPKAVILFNAALRRDTTWPEDVPVLNMYNSNDMVVQLGRMWSRLVSLGGLTPHGWGAAGRYGFTNKQSNVMNFNMGDDYYSYHATGHSDALKSPKVQFWANFVSRWLTNYVETDKTISP